MGSCGEGDLAKANATFAATIAKENRHHRSFFQKDESVRDTMMRRAEEALATRPPDFMPDTPRRWRKRSGSQQQMQRSQSLAFVPGASMTRSSSGFGSAAGSPGNTCRVTMIPARPLKIGDEVTIKEMGRRKELIGMVGDVVAAEPDALGRVCVRLSTPGAAKVMRIKKDRLRRETALDEIPGAEKLVHVFQSADDIDLRGSRAFHRSPNGGGMWSQAHDETGEKRR
eukprot:gnl/TRDRNA2_/TRDRNA2_36271_c0_seq2.p1 gnl/TRDRNA2_/TRDRNA2_36271_c0~~gnl/TRDRNA2_/TRDRNA2_36271_c0_seq2.p1  ORF type:complete len:260 (-),score=46.49 gnl/TRDRNA2_/TRDRNA2_36271_c0_seq2:331-1011(-)